MTEDNPVIPLSWSWTNQLFHTTGSNCFSLTRLQVSQETGKSVWYSHLSKISPQFVVIHIVKGFSIVEETEIDAFYGIPLFYQRSTEHWQFDLLILSLSFFFFFLNPAWTSGSSWFAQFWSLAWKILSMTLLALEVNAIDWCLAHSLVLPFLGIRMRMGTGKQK